jgi:tRNA-2-methylthio-N6-dimethylallyladenosine synthase
MNERDSEAVAAQLANRGYALVDSEGGADVILLNTCSVRDAAEQKAIGKMQNLAAETKRKSTKTILGFLGCMAQARGPALQSTIKGLDLVIGTRQYHKTADYLDDLLAGKQNRICDISEEAPNGKGASLSGHLAVGPGKTSPVSAFVNIMQGCNQYCTFCIVPFTRGEESCRLPDEVVQEVRSLAAQGVREITLLGQIVTSYGRREMPVKDGKSPFVQLLEAVHEVDGIDRIRFTAPHPKGYGDDLVEAYGRLPKLCESAHIPIQSGSDRILKLMHRGYTAERSLDIIRKLRQIRPAIGITTDLIVGFPGETDRDFEDTLALVRAAEFDNAFQYKYSPRQGTPAADMEGHLPREIKESRLAELLKQVDEIAVKRYERMTGQMVQVLVEGPSRKNSARLTGRSRCNKIVVFEGDDRMIGQLLNMRVTRTGSFTLYGDPALINLD